MSPIVESLVDQLDGLRQRWWLFSLLTTITLGFTASLGAFFLLMLLDAQCRFSQIGLVLCAVCWLGVTLYFGTLIVRRLLRDDRTLDGTARIIEGEYPQLENRLINVVQLSRKLQESTPESITIFEMAAVQRAATEVDRETLSGISAQFGRFTRFRRCMQTPRDWCESILLLAMVLGFAFVVAHHVPAWSSSANRLLQPWRFRPAVGLVGDIHVTPGDATVLVDTDLDVLGEIENPTGKEWTGTLYIREKLDPSKKNKQNTANGESTAERAIPLVAQDGYTQFTATIPAIASPLQ